MSKIITADITARLKYENFVEKCHKWTYLKLSQIDTFKP